MAYSFKLTKATLRREYAVYVVIARSEQDIQLYVGKTGDNREGCTLINPYSGKGYIPNNEKAKRAALRTNENEKKIQGIIEEVSHELQS